MRYFTGTPCRRGHICERQTSNKTCIECGLAADRARHAKNPNLKRSQVKRWRCDNPERQKGMFIRYQSVEKNREKIRARKRRLYAKNPEPFLTRGRNRKAMRRQAVGKHSIGDVREILKAQKSRCAYCRVKLSGYHVDHIRPLARGGSNDRRNLQILCGPCNLKKCAIDPIDFARRIGRLI